MLPKNSLAARHFYASAILLPIFLGIIALALDEAFRSSQLSAEESSLRTQIYLLIGAAEPDETSLYLPEEIQEPRYSLPNSGLYATVINEDGHSAWQSKSLILMPDLAKNIPLESFSTNREFFDLITFKKKTYFYFTFDTIWNIANQDKAFRFISIHSANDFDKEIRSYRKTLWQWLGALGLLLITTQLFVVRWGLIPLKNLAEELYRFQKGETQHLEGKYPAEISPVTENLNAVLDSERQQRERYRNTLSDLAHSLKTPLAVVRAEIRKKESEALSAAQIDEQISRMAEIINHQLQRATVRSTHVLNNTVELKSIAIRLGAALQKVYSEKEIHFQTDIPAEVRFSGEEADAMELLGNLVENAFKYGHKQVKVSATISNKDIVITIEDDGPGITNTLKKEILQRGARADTSSQGQGIGLAIAVDIISSYNGSLSIENSSLGGACFSITLPSF